MKAGKSKEYLKHMFSDDEKKDIAIEMAQKVAELNQAEDQKKAINSDLKSKIDGLQATINHAAVRLNNGYEMRSIECEVTPAWDEKVWQYTKLDTGEIVKQVEMSPEDLQMRLLEE